MSTFPERVTEQRRQVVERIIADMKASPREWLRPFECAAAPHNPISDLTYKGGNRLHLSCIAAIRGYEDPRWMTFNQAKKEGYHLKKGAKSAIVEKWKAYRIDNGADVEADNAEDLSRVFLKCIGYWSVFNFEEFEDTPAWMPPIYENTADAASDLADTFIASSRCDITEERSDQAYYSPTTDSITVPLRGQFTDNGSFLRVLWHEMTHSTMHSLTPAARESGGMFGTPSYAYEELIAELGSVFIGNDCAISTEADTNHYEQHIAYLQSWISALADDPAYLFRAAAMAQKAADYLVSNLAVEDTSCYHSLPL